MGSSWLPCSWALLCSAELSWALGLSWGLLNSHGLSWTLLGSLGLPCAFSELYWVLQKLAWPPLALLAFLRSPAFSWALLSCAVLGSVGLS